MTHLHCPTSLTAIDRTVEGQATHRVLDQIQALVDGLEMEPSGPCADQDDITLIDPSDAALIPALAALIRQAQSSVEAVIGAHPQSIDARLQTVLTQAPESAHVRLLCAPATADQSILASIRLRASQSATRVCSVPLPELFVVDGRTALVRCTLATARGISVVRSPPVVRALHGLFAVMWRSATPAAEHRSIARWLVTSDVARQVLQQMDRGTTDEAAARELVMSVRTYRRHVAELMRLLGAHSRFQAGARAARLGLLGPPG